MNTGRSCSVGIGRYAPSPTGPLHFGSLVAAVASYMQARSQGHAWYVRIEDLDPPREVPGAADTILWQLEAFGLRWDGTVLYQSERTDAYVDAVDRLKRLGLAFDCGCTRREARTGSRGLEGPIYPGTCRNGLAPGRAPRSVRLRVPAGERTVMDGLQGRIGQDLSRDVGDFVLRRADGLHAYQLAVVVDDASQGVTEVVRGADLLDSTLRQVYLQQCLGLPTPSYVHLPVMVDQHGDKLSKSSGAGAIDADRPVIELVRAFRALGLRPPPVLNGATVEEAIGWACESWTLDRVPRGRSQPLKSLSATEVDADQG